MVQNWKVTLPIFLLNALIINMTDYDEPIVESELD